MKWRHILLVLAVQLSLTLPASAGFFSKNEPSKPAAQRVPELLDILARDPGEKKRESAAEELSQFDPRDFPQMVPALIAALQRDTNADVRVEAARTLSKLRPFSKEVGDALEHASDKDPSFHVRWHAQMMFWSYERDGYRAPDRIPSGWLNPHPGGGYNPSE